MLFTTVGNSEYFSQRVSLILFLNKIDLFAEKLAHVSIQTLFPDFEGGFLYSSKINVFSGGDDYEKSLAHVGLVFKTAVECNRKV